MNWDGRAMSWNAIFSPGIVDFVFVKVSKSTLPAIEEQRDSFNH